MALEYFWSHKIRSFLCSTVCGSRYADVLVVYNKLNTCIEMYCMCKEAGIVENHSLRAIEMTCVTSTKRISLHDDDVIVT